LSYSTDDSVKNVCDVQKEKHVVAVKWEGEEVRPPTYATRNCYPVQSETAKRRYIERINSLRTGKDLFEVRLKLKLDLKISLLDSL
jgi:hypothetical protein